MKITPTFAFSTSQIVSGVLLHPHPHGRPGPHVHYQSHCVHPAKSYGITPKARQSTMCSQLKQGLWTSAQTSYSTKLLLIDAELELLRTQTRKETHIAALHEVQLWLLCSLQTHLITTELIIIWDKPKVSKFFLFTFFFPKMQIHKSVSCWKQTRRI